MEKAKDYNYSFGILTALAIIFVVAGHLDYKILTIDDFFPYYSFHMGLFMFISGYFYKKDNEEQVKMFLWKKIKHLIIPYYSWNLFYALLVMILKKYGFAFGSQLNLHTLFIQPIIDGHQFYFNLASWFVPALFIVEVVYLLECKLFRRIINNPIICVSVIFIVSIFLGMFGIVLANRGYSYSYWLILIRTMFFLPFYSMGNTYKDVLEKMDHVKDIVYLAFVWVGIFLIFMHYGWIPTFSAVFGQLFWNPVIQYVTAFLGIAFWLRIAKIITPIVKKHYFTTFYRKITYKVLSGV